MSNSRQTMIWKHKAEVFYYHLKICSVDVWKLMMRSLSYTLLIAFSTSVPLCFLFVLDLHLHLAVLPDFLSNQSSSEEKNGEPWPGLWLLLLNESQKTLSREQSRSSSVVPWDEEQWDWMVFLIRRTSSSSSSKPKCWICCFAHHNCLQRETFCSGKVGGACLGPSACSTVPQKQTTISEN